MSKKFFLSATILKIGILRIVICVPNPSFYEICVCFSMDGSGFWGVCLEPGIGSFGILQILRVS